MTMRRRLVAIGVLGLVGFGLAACGDDEDSLSEEEFLEQANAICDEGGDALDAAAEELFGTGEPSEAQLADFADTFEENIGGQIESIEELSGPDELEDDLEPVLADARDALETFVEQLREDPASVLAGEEDPFAAVNERLTELGLPSCSE